MEAVAYTDGDTVIEVHVNDEKPHPEVPVASGLPHVPRPAPARREMGPVSVPVDSRLQCRNP